MSGDFFLDTADVLRYLNESSALFGDEDEAYFPSTPVLLCIVKSRVMV